MQLLDMDLLENARVAHSARATSWKGLFSRWRDGGNGGLVARRNGRRKTALHLMWSE